ncbi:LLM class F420-dependent oxidoreductase [Segniliparus rugosus]|uniref:Luciferase-like domain-containing protein n=1 Tax=Segniliparus rugosus (strain ATCC BAA-974 / DSM 45345 / CCUG 50838 / CIP 108380 / JCM 13579 / CDC 945) TaxID=679197 RepID=U1LNA4_SEGRC|nr:LLM class F420-dependent oxidoreductase [Segniliparus rugosus]ERG69411.1 hypothetical protein HMPREF9336_04107 [Segniliparus rugosus ATCC BAA-974]
MSRPIRISVQSPATVFPDYQQVRDRVQRLEDIGVDVIFGYDHFYTVQIPSRGELVAVDQPQDLPNFEPLTTLAAWAEQTSRADVGLLVTGIGYRNPDLLADIARTIDHISGGRHILGLGAGWYKPDYDEYGYEFGTFTTRFQLFEEGLERIKARFAKLNPAPLRQIPILIGGTGEKKTLPLVAKYADIWHSFGDIPSLQRRKDILAGLLEQNNRPADAVEISQEWPGVDKADEYVAAGVTFFNISLFNPVQAPFLDLDDDLSSVKEAVAWRDKANG